MLGTMLKIRRATPSDADALAQTVAEGFASYREFAPPGWTPPDRLEFALGIAVRLRRPNMTGWIAEDEAGAAAGHVTYLPAAESRDPVDDPRLAHLEQLFVRPAHWGSGIAARLLAVAVADATESGYATMRLATPVDHLRARRFYEREGWAPHGEPFSGDAIGLRLLEYRLALRERG
jgi:GNAT superfamily N-acetyltransferase